MGKLIFDTYMAYGDSNTTRFVIETEDIEAADDLKEKIVKAVAENPVFCNDLTGELWMFDQKLEDYVWLENIHPSNDLTTVYAGLYFME